MGIGDWFIEKIEDCGKAVCEAIEDTGRKIARRGDALFGCEEYENASFGDRLSGLAGLHDNGTFKAQIEKKEIGIRLGDVVGVSRGIYDHYGVFVNNKEVISYTSDDSDIGGNNTIQTTSLKRFLRGADEYFVLVFPTKHGKPDHVRFPSIASACFPGAPENLSKLLKTAKYKLYSSTETVERAKSRIGEDRYNLLFNNCEHFAIWCKTGIEESHQINNLLEIIKPVRLEQLT